MSLSQTPRLQGPDVALRQNSLQRVQRMSVSLILVPLSVARKRTVLQASSKRPPFSGGSGRSNCLQFSQARDLHLDSAEFQAFQWGQTWHLQAPIPL